MVSTKLDGAWAFAIEALEPRRLLAATLLQDFVTAPAQSEATFLGALPTGTALVRALDAIGRPGLWATDGTPGAARRVGDVDPAELDTYRGLLGGTMFFAGETAQHGVELWKSDGTAAGTMLVADLATATGPYRHSRPRNFVAAGEKMFFIANTGSSGYEGLWVSDGTAAGTRLIASAPSSSSGWFSTAMAGLNGKLYFVMQSEELWVTDGTPAGTSRVIDFNPQNIPGGPNIQGGVVNAGGWLMFLANYGGLNLYRSDGTNLGTELVTQLFTTSGSAYNLHAVGARLFFDAGSGPGTGQKWATDGTAAGTRPLMPIFAAFAGSLGDVAFFRDVSGGHERIYRSDGTAAGTALIADLATPADPDERLRAGYGVGGAFYFRAYDAAHGSELWKTDGTAEGTALARDVEPGAAGSLPGPFGAVNGKLLFGAATSDTGAELRALDLGNGALDVAIDIPGTASSNPTVLASGDGVAYLAATDPFTGRQSLWKTDGTSQGTRFVAGNLSPVSEPTLFDGRLYYVSEYVLYSTDGTGVTQVSPTPTDGSGYGAYYVAATSSGVYWSSKEPVTSSSSQSYAYLNSTSGLRVRFNDPGPTIVTMTFDSAPYLHVVNDQVWAHFWDYNTRRFAWYREGAFASYDWRLRVVEPVLTPEPLPPGEITVGGARYFAFDDGVHGTELWVEDANGSRLLQDINPGPDPSSPGDFRLVGNHVVFAALDPMFGREAWTLTPDAAHAVDAGARQVRSRVLGRSGLIDAFNGLVSIREALRDVL